MTTNDVYCISTTMQPGRLELVSTVLCICSVISALLFVVKKKVKSSTKTIAKKPAAEGALQVVAPQMSQEEFDHIGICAESTHYFLCKKCTPHKKLHILSAMNHLVKFHNADPAMIKGWVVAKDSLKIKNKSKNCLMLTLAIGQYVLKQESEGSQADTPATPLLRMKPKKL